MTRTQYYTASTLDGFIADAENSLEWLFQFGAEPGGSYEEFIQHIGALVMGSTTYEWVLNYEKLLDPGSTRSWPYHQPTWVMTTRDLPAVPGADIRFARGDVRDVHRQMSAAAGDKNIWVVGGGDLAGQFLDCGLLDDVIVTIAAVTLGAGAPLLPRRISHPPLRLVSVKQYGTAYAELAYQVQK